MEYEQSFSFLTEQMSVENCLKRLKQAGADAVMKELEQIIYMNVLKRKKASELTREKKRAALRYLMFLTQKRCGRIKGRRCTNGRKQCIYKCKDKQAHQPIALNRCSSPA